MNAGRFRLASILAVFALAGSLAGCSVDDASGVERIPGDSEEDRILDELGIICESTLSVTGTFTPNPIQPSPDEFTGCGGIGTWNITTTLDRVGCNPQPAARSFTYEAVYDAENTTINVFFPDDPDNERLNIKITADSSGCIGTFDHYELDNSVWAIQAPLEEDNTLSGSGTYRVYLEDSF